ncbi:MAG: protease inhibitor I42 family protein [Chloroflexi bacterium]|nr:protease inhibitor I42 family protein [Chloroflexota bacterium]
MKVKLALLGMMALVALIFAACGGAEGAAELKQWDVIASCDNFFEQGNITRNLEVAVGDTITVTLCSNASTGFKWSETAQISDPNKLEQVKHEYVAPQAGGDGAPLVGAAGKEVWTFKALERGTTTVAMEYSRPWEGGEKGVWTFVLTVTVE